MGGNDTRGRCHTGCISRPRFERTPCDGGIGQSRDGDRKGRGLHSTATSSDAPMEDAGKKDIRGHYRGNVGGGTERDPVDTAVQRGDSGGREGADRRQTADQRKKQQTATTIPLITGICPLVPTTTLTFNNLRDTNCYNVNIRNR